MQGPELLLPASAAACLLQQPQQSRRHTWHLRGACTLAPALAWTSRQSSGQDQQDASCSGAGQGATSAGAASSTAADRRCQAPALSPPSASALCSAKTCGAHAGSAHAVLRGLRGLRTRARHAAAELGGSDTGSAHVVPCERGEPRAGALGRRRQACRPSSDGAPVMAGLPRAGSRQPTPAARAHREGLLQQARHAVPLRCAEQVLEAWPLGRGGAGWRRRPRVWRPRLVRRPGRAGAVVRRRGRGRARAAQLIAQLPRQRRRVAAQRQPGAGACLSKLQLPDTNNARQPLLCRRHRQGCVAPVFARAAPGRQALRCRCMASTTGTR